MPAALDAEQIRSSLDPSARDVIDELVVLSEVPSTNTWLMQQELHEPARFGVVLAKHQTAGRGQRSRRWYSPRGAGLYLSVGYTFAQNPNNISCLTLAAGVAVAKALREMGVNELMLKWPNDLYVNDAKLGGILTDAQTAPGDRITMICGVGINFDLGDANDEEAARAGIGERGYAPTDLRSQLDTLPAGSDVAARIIEALVIATQQFETSGLEPFIKEWNGLDRLLGEAVNVDLPDGQIHGIADGIDASGALRVMTKQGRRRVFTGSVRLAAPEPS